MIWLRRSFDLEGKQKYHHTEAANMSKFYILYVVIFIVIADTM